MVLQQDKGSAPPPFDTGLPRVQASEDVPRWLVVLGIAAACTLLVALLRYAIDLLGVVFLIILVGFSIRAVSDWLTEGESVSGWALAAVFAGLFGTVLVGLWLFGSRDMTSGVFEHGVPPPIASAADWLEAHGWGQRVLLSGGGGGGGPTAPSMPGTSAPLSASGSGGGSSSPRAEPGSASSPASRAADSEPPSRERKATPRGDAGEAEAATAPSSSPSGPPGSRSPAGVSGTQGQASPPAAAEAPAASQPAADSSTSTSTTVSSSHATSTVGTSVRFTATVTGDGAGVPTGIVVFYDGDRSIGVAPVHGTGVSVTAALSTLDLGLGDHQIAAEFHGTHGFLNSRSEPIAQTVTRR